jgi:hypothetical protein
VFMQRLSQSLFFFQFRFERVLLQYARDAGLPALLKALTGVSDFTVTLCLTCCFTLPSDGPVLPSLSVVSFKASAADYMTLIFHMFPMQIFHMRFLCQSY